MDRTWKVGVVAETSGVTVRTLHHWDEIGLLPPSRRGDGGHRLYTDDDLARLYIILTLRGLGLSLQSVKACLDADVDRQRVFIDHLARLDADLVALSRLREQVAAVVAAGVEDRTVAHANELLRLMRDARLGSQDVLDDYLDDEQRAALVEGAKVAGSALPYLLDIEWPSLYRRADQLRRSGAQPDDQQVQQIVGRLDELAAMVSGGTTGAGLAVRQAWRDHPAAMSGEAEEVAGPWTEVADFVEQARAGRGRTDGEERP
jgi:MerR family transcriptional regulator, thiopeptide resistance regulator